MAKGLVQLIVQTAQIDESADLVLASRPTTPLPSSAAPAAFETHLTGSAIMEAGAEATPRQSRANMVFCRVDGV